MHRWGYAPTIEALAAQLLGGAVREDALLHQLEDASRFTVQGRFAALRGSEDLIPKSRERVTSHHRSAAEARAVAREFAEVFARHVALVDCIALSGSLATGGFRTGDDIDFDIFSRDGTKYVTYLAALLLGATFSIRYRRTHGLRKLICVNVIWTPNQVRPFVRNDDGLAFELLNCQPLVGGAYYQRVLHDNPWICGFFPQVERRVDIDVPLHPPSVLGRFLRWLERHPRGLAVAERWSRRVSFVIYTVVHRMRASDARAAARLEFLRRVKFPYEVFQDSP
ncbi:MAG TPA: hypothetical protein VI999_03740 [Thermoplasmata archaeon]|nr:hypothetical protein [Thermoplasmata archaeon]